MSEQLFLDLNFPEETAVAAPRETEHQLRRQDVRRAMVAWLAGRGAAGLALRVPTRRTRFQADVAAFWNVAKRNRQRPGPGELHVPCRTAIVECRSSRAECWPHCSESAELLPRLRALRRDAMELEAEIRVREPHLREPGALFEEYSDWHYDHSQNRSYQTLREEVRRYEKALYGGTRFEVMREAGLADQLFLAVPEHTVHPHELAEGWGLLWVGNALGITPIKQAADLDCSPDHRFHLVQNIAAASLTQVLFSLGVELNGEGTRFRLPPRRRAIRRSRGTDR